MNEDKVFIAELRGASFFGRHAVIRAYIEAQPGQPMLLSREPTNPADTNAIIVSDLNSLPCGYVAREVAARVAPLMDQGLVPICTIRSKGAISTTRLIVFPQVTIRFTPGRRIRGLVLEHEHV